MDGCKEGDGNGWCFKGSVGNLLPATFFSYQSQTSPSGTLATTGSGNSTTVSSGSSSNSTTVSSGSSSNSTSTDDGSDGSDDDDSSDDDSDDNSSGSSASVSSTSTSATATASPSKAASSSGGACKATRKRASHSRRRHHQKAVERAQGLNQLGHSQSQSSRRHHRRGSSKTTTTSDDSGSTSSQGYKDGLALAQKFAESGSKIGFLQQYLADNGKDGSYATDFANGIADGEAAHDKALRRRR